MKKIAIFGKPGSGKSVLSERLAAVSGIELYQLDSILYKKNGDRVDRESYDQKHAAMLATDRWIIDGFDLLEPFKQRIEAADTLIYIDLPYVVSYFLVTKRLLKGVLIKPQGWPEGSSVLKGSLQSYRALKLSRKFWNDDFKQQLLAMSNNKSVYIIDSIAGLNQFVDNYTVRH